MVFSLVVDLWMLKGTCVTSVLCLHRQSVVCVREREMAIVVYRTEETVSEAEKTKERPQLFDLHMPKEPRHPSSSFRVEG